MKNKKQNEVVQYNGQLSGILQNEQTYNEILNGIDKTYHNISGLLSEGKLSDDDLEYINKKVALDTLSKNIKRDIDYTKIDINKELQDFLLQYDSEDTKKVYLMGISNYMKFCKDDSIEYLKTDSKKVQSYIQYLRGVYSTATVHTYIKGNSSFFQYLHREYYDTIKINPFKKQKIPKIKGKYKKDFLEPNDFRNLCKYLIKIKSYDYLCMVKYLYKTGHRIGIFKQMNIRNDGSWTSISKGQPYKGKLTKEEMRNFKKYNILKMNLKTASSKIKTYTIRLFNQGEVSCTFSVHDIRRDTMRRDMKNIGAEKIIKVSKKYHKNINTTMGYINEFYEK